LQKLRGFQSRRLKNYKAKREKGPGSIDGAFFTAYSPNIQLQAMKENVKLYDVVALTVDLPEYKLKRGYVGIIVESPANGSAFEVEFNP